MLIPLVDLRRQYKTISKEIEDSIRKVIHNSDFILGEDVRKLEEEFSKFCGAKFGVGVDSGTGALELALHALGIGPGDEVLVPVFTFYATASAVSSTGARPVFVDVEQGTGNMDVTQIENKITSKTKAILPVHLFGQPANLMKILPIAEKHHIPLIEDSAQAHGAKLEWTQGNWRTVGSIGKMGCFSFYPGKNLGAYGDGGMVVTNDFGLAHQLKLLRDCGRTGKYQHDILGYNKRLDTLQAAILRVKLKKLNRWNQKRREKAELYDSLLNRIGVRTFEVRPFAVPVRHVYAIRVSKRDALAEFLKQNGVATGVHYPIPLHLQKAFGTLGYSRGDFPVAESISQEILSLPIFPELKESEIKKIVSLIAKFQKQS